MAPVRLKLEPPPGIPAVRILVVEDNRSDVFLLERALRRQGLLFELIHLANGGEALRFIRRQGAYADTPIPDLILMDLNLDKYTGEDILREIRAAHHLACIPVCAWSSSQSRRDQSVLMELGITRFITKPSGLEKFMEIGRILADLLARPAAVADERCAAGLRHRRA